MNNIVFVGAGGTGMSWLAMLLFDIGYKNIICINNIKTDLTDRLLRHGLQVIIWHGNYAVQLHDIVVYSDIQSIIDWPEITQSRLYQQSPTKKHYHICLTYNELLAEISKRFVTISVAGSNGKTSTTAMAIWSLNQVADNFGLGIVGGLMPNFEHQWYALTQNTAIQSDIFHLFEHIFNQKHQLDYTLLKKYIFVVEACEHREHFLLYDSDYCLITNIERDHVDYYTTSESYRQAFEDMIIHTRKNSILTPNARTNIEMKELPENIVVSDLLEIDSPHLLGSFVSSNAGMIESLFKFMEIESTSLVSTLEQFKGVGRRMELIGTIGEKIVYSDYGHHAPALAGNITALRKQFPDKKICAIFQPHQGQRVLAWWKDFQQALEWVEKIMIYRIYSARENFSDLQKEYSRLESLSSFDELGQLLAQEMKSQYYTNLSFLKEDLDALPNDYIIVYFSAWDLDEEMRKVV